MKLHIMEDKKMNLFSLLLATVIGISSLGVTATSTYATSSNVGAYEEQESSKSDSSNTVTNNNDNYFDKDFEEYKKSVLSQVTEIDGKKVYIPTGTKKCTDKAGRTYYKPGSNSSTLEATEDYIVVNGYKLSLDGKTVLAVPFEETNCILPEGITAVNISAFFLHASVNYGYDEGCISWVTQITLPKSLKKINYDDEEFFQWNNEMSITNLTLKGTKLSAKDFSKMLRHFGALKATDIHTPKKVGKCKNGMFIYKKYLVRYTGKAKKLVVPKGTVGISAYAFSPFYMSCSVDNDYGFEEYLNGNKHLKQVVLPKSMKTIGKYAFFDCKKLSKISIAKGGRIKSIGKKAFTGTKIKAAQRKSLV
ncbi:MAG: leucine-rich repeat domain-containing protein [Eubacterium sp.]|nr:leucine-rich repeat domain-containing protein [Eubacterium sp.]